MRISYFKYFLFIKLHHKNYKNTHIYMYVCTYHFSCWVKEILSNLYNCEGTKEDKFRGQAAKYSPLF